VGIAPTGPTFNTVEECGEECLKHGFDTFGIDRGSICMCAMKEELDGENWLCQTILYSNNKPKKYVDNTISIRCASIYH